MFTVNTFNYDCTRKCRYRQHGNTITAALTKRSIDDEKLAAFIAKTCCNFCEVVDDLGRSAVHLASSVGRYSILEWLLNQGAFINGRDFESGYSPLHRAIYYGCIDCAVLLIRYGASLELFDDDTRCALQGICRICDFPNEPERVQLKSAIKKTKIYSNTEILVWGSNKNYNLGMENEEDAGTPQFIDFFRKQNISIKAVALGMYHSFFLDQKSVLYAVGHGKGGRLGIGIENSLPVPMKVKVPIKNTGEVIIDISVSRKHSLLLTNRSAVFACGINENHQLGVRGADTKLTTFKEVVTLRDLGISGLKHVIARDFHSLVYSHEAIFVWGTNRGQMNINGDIKVIPTPQQVKLAAGVTICLVEANDFATAIYTNDASTILLLYNFKMKSLKIPDFEDLKSMCLVGGDNSSTGKGSVSALKLLMLTKTNVIFVWYEKTQSFYRCIFSHIKLTEIDKILYRSNQVLILSQGDVYHGKCYQVPVINSSSRHDRSDEDREGQRKVDAWSNNSQNRVNLSKDYMIRIGLQHLPTIDRAINIYCDDDFLSFAVLQESSMKYFKLPPLLSEEYTYKKLLNDANKYDGVHDVVFHVDGETFIAHKLLIYARAPGLREIVDNNTKSDNGSDVQNVYLNFSLLSGKMFELMLKYIYANYFPNDDDFDAIRQSLGPESPSGRTEICLLFLEFVEKFRLKDLANYLRLVLDDDSFPYVYNLQSKYPFKRLHRNDFPSLHDVRIKCANEVEVSAHKCILVTNLEYFEMMFRHSWAEQTTISQCTVPVEYMVPILDFLYNSDIDHFCRQQYTEAFLYNMIVFCDQFFIERLRNVCEILILDKINIRKCGAMLDFAHTYNCEFLKKGCLEFICQNLARVLTYRSLENCESEALKCLNEHYRQMFKAVFDYRLVTPSSEAVDDELLLSFVDDFEIELNYRKNEEEISVKKLGNTKQKESEIKRSARQYEREAISSMIASMNLDEEEGGHAKVIADKTRNKILDEAKASAERFQAESKAWIKVSDKKEQHKKRPSVEQIPQAKELYDEDKFVPLQTLSTGNELLRSPQGKAATTTVTSTITTTPPTTSTSPKTSTPRSVFHINLSDLTTSREKTSQKQRKRLSAELNRVVPTTPPSVETAKTPHTPTSVQNSWGVPNEKEPNSPSISDLLNGTSPPTGSSADSTSFANMTRTGTISKRIKEHNDLTKIMAEEKQQRVEYERMRSKSLHLTQIEETAIAELRRFYNVDNIYDEVITIERKSKPTTMNFAVWQRN